MLMEAGGRAGGIGMPSGLDCRKPCFTWWEVDDEVVFEIVDLGGAAAIFAVGSAISASASVAEELAPPGSSGVLLQTFLFGSPVFHQVNVNLNFPVTFPPPRPTFPIFQNSNSISEILGDSWRFLEMLEALIVGAKLGSLMRFKRAASDLNWCHVLRIPQRQQQRDEEENAGGRRRGRRRRRRGRGKTKCVNWKCIIIIIKEEKEKRDTQREICRIKEAIGREGRGCHGNQEHGFTEGVHWASSQSERAGPVRIEGRGLATAFRRHGNSFLFYSFLLSSFFLSFFFSKWHPINGISSIYLRSNRIGCHWGATTGAVAIN